jgi:hypothetical protein
VIERETKLLHNTRSPFVTRRGFAPPLRADRGSGKPRSRIVELGIASCRAAGDVKSQCVTAIRHACGIECHNHLQFPNGFLRACTRAELAVYRTPKSPGSVNTARRGDLDVPAESVRRTNCPSSHSSTSRPYFRRISRTRS